MSGRASRSSHRDASVGTPPDAFSETGQDWGLPVYLWDAMHEDDFGWLRARGRRMAAMFDAFRIDHLVGFYRTYWRPASGDAPFFVPADEANQRVLGEAVIEAFASAGAALIAEDLGTIPDFVRASLESLQLPGYKVLRWERHWHVHGQPFHDPATYAPASLATTGTHDTDMLADWWDAATLEEKTALLAIPGLRESGVTADQPFDDSRARRTDRGADAIRVEPRGVPAPGPVRVARPHQRARHRRPDELELGQSDPCRSPDGRPCRARACRDLARDGRRKRQGRLTPNA